MISKGKGLLGVDKKTFNAAYKHFLKKRGLSSSCECWRNRKQKQKLLSKEANGNRSQ